MLNHFDCSHKQRLFLLANDHSAENLVIQEKLSAHLFFKLYLDLSAVIRLYHFGVLLDYGAVTWIIDKVYLGDSCRRFVGGDVDDNLSASQDWELEIKSQCFNNYLLSDWNGVLQRGKHETRFDCFKGSLINEFYLKVDVVSDHRFSHLLIIYQNFLHKTLGVQRQNNELLIFFENSSFYFTRQAMSLQLAVLGFEDIGYRHSERFIDRPRWHFQACNQLNERLAINYVLCLKLACVFWSYIDGIDGADRYEDNGLLAEAYLDEIALKFLLNGYESFSTPLNPVHLIHRHYQFVNSE